jgi:hypothetical protein
VVLVDLEELAVVHDEPHDVAHVVRLVRAVGDHRVQLGVHAVRRVGRQHARRRLEVVLRQEPEQVAGVLQELVLVVGARWATPDFVLWVIAPPSDSKSTSSPVTVLITSGPVMNMCELSFTMRMKSVIAGE